MENIPGADDTITSVANPPAAAPNGVMSFFGFLGNALGQGVSNLAANSLAEMNAKSQAKVQAMLNANHQINPATGPNDPNAAQTAANRTFLEKFLPSTMLYKKDASGVQTPTPFYYAFMAGLVLLVVLVIVRLFRR